MALPRRPAAYLPAAAPSVARAAALAAAQRGWPPPAVYAGPEALERLRAAVTAGRHDALLMPPAGAVGAMAHPAALVALLAACTAAGVPVSLAPLSAVPEPAAAAGQPGPGAGPSGDLGPGGPGDSGPAASGLAASSSAASGSAASGSAAVNTGAILRQASLEALAGVFPSWRIWADARGWHARRQAGDGYVQSRQAGTPVYHVSAPGAVSLAAQLLWQQAADRHTPNGCTAARGDGPGRAPGHGQVTRAS
jgi:hypothetical protein